MIFQGIRTRVAKKRYIFENFQGRSGPPAPHSGSAHVSLISLTQILIPEVPVYAEFNLEYNQCLPFFH